MDRRDFCKGIVMVPASTALLSIPGVVAAEQTAKSPAGKAAPGGSSGTASSSPSGGAPSSERGLPAGAPAAGSAGREETQSRAVTGTSVAPTCAIRSAIASVVST